MHPQKQDQHKIPQVYLRQFGYTNSNNQSCVSVLQEGETWTRQKSIKSFTAETNFFDIPSYDQEIVRMFEKLNCALETEFNAILADLDTSQQLSHKSYAYLVQLVVNLIGRSDYWRNWIKGLLRHENKEIFLKVILIPICKDWEDLKAIDKKPYYRLLVDGDPEEVINRVILYFMNHLLIRLELFEVVILQSKQQKPWFTTTNPVVVHHRPAPNEIIGKDSEIYFPLSPKYLVYFHFKGSDDQKNELRHFDTNKVYIATDEQNDHIQKEIILKNPAEFIIVCGELRYRYLKK